MEFEDRTGWSPKRLASYESRITLGDIVEVMPDDHIWGGEEGPPKFIIIKVTDMTVAEAKGYIVSLFGEPTMEKGRLRINCLKVRRYSVPGAVVQNILAEGGTKEITSAAIRASLKDKNGN